MSKRKEFSILKWIIFPLNSIILAGAIAWFNLAVFGFSDGLPYALIVGLIGIFSITINKFTESDNRTLARAAFVFEIVLTAALVGNAAWSISVQREMSVARMGEQSQAVTIGEISKLKGSRTQRKALDKISEQKGSAEVFAKYEKTLFWIMVAELGLYGLSAFTLFALARLMDQSPAPYFAQNAPEGEFPEELDVGYAPRRKNAPELHLSQKPRPVATPVALDRKGAAKVLREHLGVIASYYPGRWFKVDLRDAGGVWIRMAERQEGREVDIAKTLQSDKLLAAVNRPDFRERLIRELIDCGFPIGGER